MKGSIHYIRVGDYEIPDLKLPEETRSICLCVIKK